MITQPFPESIPNLIGGQEQPAASQFEKRSPATGAILCRVARSDSEEVHRAVEVARLAQTAWAEMPPVQRGEILSAICTAFRANRDKLAHIVALETGKSVKAAMGEVDGAIALGMFYSGEGQRLYGRTTTSGTPDKTAMTIRQPVGVAGLIIAANTPVPNFAWKVFPALICGNAVVLKAAEDAPISAWACGRLAAEAGLPTGVLNVVQGLGREAGAALVADPGVDVISFTGSSAVGREIATVAGGRLAKVSLELGGKNPLVVCDDADLEKAVHWTLLSAFSNAGQRCASGSRIIVFEKVYETFRDQLVERTRQLRVGSGDDDDLGPVINERQLNGMLAAIDKACQAGATILTGGKRLTSPELAAGCYLAPTIIENAANSDAISRVELFGPICCLYCVKDFAAALALANDSPYGLTASIHTRNFHRAWQFVQKVQTGVAVVNAGTFGSEPHMPFGGVKQSGNGSREPGTEALDIYSNLKDVYLVIDPSTL